MFLTSECDKLQTEGGNWRNHNSCEFVTITVIEIYLRKTKISCKKGGHFCYVPKGSTKEANWKHCSAANHNLIRIHQPV